MGACHCFLHDVAANDNDFLTKQIPTVSSAWPSSSSRCVFSLFTSASYHEASSLTSRSECQMSSILFLIFQNSSHNNASHWANSNFLKKLPPLMIQSDKPSMCRWRSPPWFLAKTNKASCKKIGRDTQLKKLLLWNSSGSHWDFASVTIPFLLKWSIQAVKRGGKACLYVCGRECSLQDGERCRNTIYSLSEVKAILPTINRAERRHGLIIK